MLPGTKLTKRQKKWIAFRQRKHSTDDKDRALAIADDRLEDGIDVHSLEHPIPVDDTQGLQGSQVSKEALVGKGKTRAEGEVAETEVVVATRKKRKAGQEAKGIEKPELKRRKGLGGDIVGDMEQAAEVRDVGEEPEETKQRFILFLGNLKYTTTPEVIQAHFSACVPPPIVRLLTPRSSKKSPAKSVTKSKGCAFLEFKHRGALQQALKLHRSELDGRQINVELTAGGGGKGLTRMKKLKERNKELESQRRKRQPPKADTQPSGTQRFSATSGAEEICVRKRTWTVGDVEEDTHRGGLKHRKSSKKRGSLSKDFRTGVNAIPVG